MRAAVRIGALNLLAAFTLLGCASEVPRVYERQIEMRELAAEVAPVDNMYRLEAVDETRDRFACSLAIAKLVPAGEVGTINLVQMTPAEEAYWVNAVCGLTELSDLQFLSPLSVVPDRPGTDTLRAAAAARDANLMLLYAPNRYGPNSAQILGVLYDVASGRPLAALHASASFLNEEGEEVSVDQETSNQRDNDAYYQASRAGEQHLVHCLGELIRLDSAAPTTQPHRWETPPSQRWWLPKGHR
ncbi:MAG: hypothetical protein KKI02_10315 [Planctomycetes bacterium]|nr:hypothetical protein [Planctomycetota bacterium]